MRRDAGPSTLPLHHTLFHQPDLSPFPPTLFLLPPPPIPLPSPTPLVCAARLALSLSRSLAVSPSRAVFALFSALGGRQSSNASATNRNPLPRGRACESVDWLTELFKFLPPTSSSIGVASVRVPMTLVFRHSKPHTWYMSGKSAGVHESATSGDSDEIIARFVNASDASAALSGLEGDESPPLRPP